MPFSTSLKLSSTQTCYQTQFAVPSAVLYCPTCLKPHLQGWTALRWQHFQLLYQKAAERSAPALFRPFHPAEWLPTCSSDSHSLLLSTQHSPFPEAAAQAQPCRSRFSHQHNRATDNPTGKKSLWCCCQISKQSKLKQVSSSPTFSSLPTGIRGDDLLNKANKFNYSSLDQFLPTNTLTTATENICLVLACCFLFFKSQTISPLLRTQEEQAIQIWASHIDILHKYTQYVYYIHPHKQCHWALRQQTRQNAKTHPWQLGHKPISLISTSELLVLLVRLTNKYCSKSLVNNKKYPEDLWGGGNFLFRKRKGKSNKK